MKIAVTAWLTFNPNTRSFNGTPSLSDVGTFSIKVQATDSSNASISDIFVIQITQFINNITGTSRNNIIQGTANNDNIQGFGGDDQLFGLAGNDTLNGGVGSDRLIGGLGNDSYNVDSIGGFSLNTIRFGDAPRADVLGLRKSDNFFRFLTHAAS
ncbi:putative Ig domain-containing protein [Calothrix anomala FACHB-343]|uniref:Ig domain-containing protein n=1 Tax=Calothrix anomala FACHB-343 TaxID=2692894 RepID=A0ABR8B6S6_9CYAN|nr:putative Ig domain-containing protein [Calothrix anomala FACHB-343]